MAIAMFPAVVGGSASYLLYGWLTSSADSTLPFSVVKALGLLLMVAILSLPLTVPFAILAIPFIPFRRWLVRETFPYLRPGYVAVVLYGPALLLLVYLGNENFNGFWVWAGLYEVVALIATLGFVIGARGLNLIDP